MTEPTTESIAADEAPFTTDDTVPSPAANDQILIELIDDQGNAHAAELVALFAFEAHEYALICPLEQNAVPEDGNVAHLQVLVMRACENGYEAIEDEAEYARVVAELEREAEEEAADATAAEQAPAA